MQTPNDTPTIIEDHHPTAKEAVECWLGVRWKPTNVEFTAGKIVVIGL